MKRLMVGVMIFLGGLVAGAALYGWGPDLLRPSSGAPPANFAAASERLHTSGQPTSAQLAGLKDKGYGLIINLAPPSTIGSVADEGRLVAGSGITYLNIPVDWERPRPEDFAQFSAMLRQAGTTKTLVHCQVNMRASVFVFLYRVIHENVAPDKAWDSVTAIWVPRDQWQDFVRTVLRQHKIAFDPAF